MPSFDVDVLRTATCVQTITVLADSRLEAQQKALDQAGDYLFSERDATYALNMEGGKNVDEFSDLPNSQLVLGCSCSDENVAHPAYVIVQATPALFRAIKTGMALCRDEGLLSVTLEIPSCAEWGPVRTYESFGNVMSHGKLAITKDDFCISAGMRHSSAVVESVDMTLNALMDHIQGGAPETIVHGGEETYEHALREQLDDDRAMATGSAPASEQPQG